MFALLDRVKGFFRKILTWFRIKIFGDNNERLDFFVDTFNKFEQKKKYMVSALGALFLFCIIGGVFYFYFWQVSKLKTNMNKGFAALHSLQRIHTQHITADAKFKDLSKQLSSATSGLKFKPLLEKLSKDMGVKIGNPKESFADFAADNPLRKDYKKVNIKLMIPKVSIPKLIKFITEIEKQEKFLSVNSVEIRELYKTKLYFKSEMIISGYSRG